METNLIQGNYKVFKGRYRDQMPLLVKEGLQPLTTKDLMQYRLQAIKDKDEIEFWLSRYFDTSTGLAYHNGNLIVVPNSQDLIGITPKSRLDNGSLILAPEQFTKLSKEYGVTKRNKIISGRELTKKEAKEHPIWLKSAQDDKHLLNEYTDAVFAETKSKYGYDTNMGVYLPDDQENPVMRGWYLRYLFDRSGADARDGLDYDNSRLLGVRAQNLEEVVSK